MPLEGIRGRIMDSSGRVLVDNQMSYNIAVIPYELKKNPKNPNSLFFVLAIETIEICIEKPFLVLVLHRQITLHNLRLHPHF